MEVQCASRAFYFSFFFFFSGAKGLTNSAANPRPRAQQKNPKTFHEQLKE